MADRLYLSLWIRGFGETTMLENLEAVLRRFPSSRLRPGITLRAYALEYAEPPLLEILLDGLPEPEEVIGLAREHLNADVAYLLETHWELWQWRGEWKLAAAPVSIECFAPQFQGDLDDHIRLCLGSDEDFLLREDDAESAVAIQSNIRSLLRLAGELEQALPLAGRRLWLESGDDFAARLEDQVF